LNAYNILQDLFKYSKSFTFTEAENFVIWIFSRLLNSQCEDLKAVGRTYRKWRVEIANAFVKNQTGENFTNALAENMNNHIKTIIKSTYGYQNFERFRKRCLLMLRYNKCQ
jgi:transposase